MVDGDLSAHINLDTLNKTHLYGLGPVAGLEGELVVIDGKIYSTYKDGSKIVSQQNKISLAAMLVYSKVEKWKEISVHSVVKNYTELEALIKQTAQKNGYNTEKPFAFKIKSSPSKTAYHVIDWKPGTEHTMDNHKQFAYSGTFSNESMLLLGFYSPHHKSIFTHHTTNMHVHILEKKSGTIGHLDDIQIDSSITIYLPEECLL
jgi:acetolactate decarboxylase